MPRVALSIESPLKSFEMCSSTLLEASMSFIWKKCQSSGSPPRRNMEKYSTVNTRLPVEPSVL